jgi:hypothetical protein
MLMLLAMSLSSSKSAIAFVAAESAEPRKTVAMQLVAVPQSQALPPDAIPLTQGALQGIFDHSKTQQHGHRDDSTSSTTSWYLYMPPLGATPGGGNSMGDNRQKIFVENMPHPHNKNRQESSSNSNTYQSQQQQQGRTARIQFVQQKLSKYSPARDQIVIVATLLGMSLLVSLIHFRNPGRWQVETAMRKHANKKATDSASSPSLSVPVMFQSFKTTDQYTVSPTPSDHSSNKDTDISVKTSRFLGSILFKRRQSKHHNNSQKDFIDVASTIGGPVTAPSAYGYDGFDTVSDFGPSLSFSRGSGLAWNDEIDQFDV